MNRHRRNALRRAGDSALALALAALGLLAGGSASAQPATPAKPIIKPAQPLRAKAAGVADAEREGAVQRTTRATPWLLQPPIIVC